MGATNAMIYLFPSVWRRHLPVTQGMGKHISASNALRQVLRQKAKDLNKKSFSIVSADDVPGISWFSAGVLVEDGKLLRTGDR